MSLVRLQDVGTTWMETQNEEWIALTFKGGRMRVLGVGGVPNVSVSFLSPRDPPCSYPRCHVLKSSLLSVSLKNSFWNLKVEPTLMHMVLATLKAIFFFLVQFSLWSFKYTPTYLPESPNLQIPCFSHWQGSSHHFTSTLCLGVLFCLLCWITPWPSRTRKQLWGSTPLPHPQTRLSSLPGFLSWGYTTGCCSISLDGSLVCVPHLCPSLCTWISSKSTLATMLRSV